jgi:uncharacterized membrane protein AbrB (regulator of aidB expression)
VQRRHGRAPRLPVFAAQTIIGCLVARGDGRYRVQVSGLPLFLSVIIGIVAASTALGWLLTRWKVLRGRQPCGERRPVARRS